MVRPGLKVSMDANAEVGCAISCAAQRSSLAEREHGRKRRSRMRATQGSSWVGSEHGRRLRNRRRPRRHSALQHSGGLLAARRTVRPGLKVSMGAHAEVGCAVSCAPQGSSWVESEHGRKRRSRMRCELRTAPGRRCLSEGRGGSLGTDEGDGARDPGKGTGGVVGREARRYGTVAEHRRRRTECGKVV